MTISELIELLEAIKSEHGDLEVSPDYPGITLQVVQGYQRPNYLEVIA